MSRDKLRERFAKIEGLKTGADLLREQIDKGLTCGEPVEPKPLAESRIGQGVLTPCLLFLSGAVPRRDRET